MVPEKGSLISSKADLPMKQKNKKNSRDKQSAVVSRLQKIEMNQCVNHKLQTKSKQQQCQDTVFKGKNFQAEKCVHMQLKKPAKVMQSERSAMEIQHNMLKEQEIVNRKPVKSKGCADKKCQATKYYKEIDKNCQTSVMQPVKPQMDVWSEKPAMKSSSKKSIGLNKNYKATMSHKKQKKCEYKDYKSQVSRNSDKNCQEIKRPRKPRNVMCSVTNTDVWLPKPARLCSDKHCQSARCSRKRVQGDQCIVLINCQ